jgi:2-hydroxycyclohexanecarboxyl-CoA dehydrogenase
MKVRQLSECTALLTGSSSGIAHEIATQLAEAGVPRIMLNGRIAERGAEACHRIKARAPGADVRFTKGDMKLPEDAMNLVSETRSAFGGVDILVNSISGSLSPRPFHEVPPDAYAMLVQAHLISTFYTCHAVIPVMIEREGGVIINMASDAAKIATPGEAIIGACKAGVVMFSKTLALENSRHGIRVHSLTPSIVRDTSSYVKVMSDEFSRKLFEKAEKRARLGVVTPPDIAPLAVFLAGPGAARMTGQAISVNGGISAG